MALAFVMIKVGAGEHMSWMRTVQEEIKKLPGVQEAHCVFGRYDLVVKLGVNSWDELTHIVGDKIRTIPGVEMTETLVAYEE